MRDACDGGVWVGGGVYEWRKGDRGLDDKKLGCISLNVEGWLEKLNLNAFQNGECAFAASRSYNGEVSRIDGMSCVDSMSFDCRNGSVA